jgi:Holliday junction resolvasome RuvABC endonuclease subunit
MNGRVRGLAGIIKRLATAECMGVCIEEPFSGQFSSVKALFPMMGAAVLPFEEAGLPYSILHLSKLKIHATGKGNAQKEAMIAAAKARFELDLDDNAADALHAASYAMDHRPFQ